MKKFATFILLTQIFSFSAHAFNAYHLYNKDGRDVWAIECADGTLHSYAGSSAGLSIVGPALCEGHGGMAEPGDTPVLHPSRACRSFDDNSRPERPYRR
jgi:hypothetical protein